jgi:hypothetical protein
MSPENSVAVNGVLTGPAGQSTRYSTVATPSASGISVSSSITPSGGNPITRTAVFTPPAAPMDDPEDFVADLLKRLKAAFKPKG